MSKIVIAVDSFKDCISSLEIAQIIVSHQQWRYPDTKFLSIPIADGGEGLVEAMAQRDCSVVRKMVHDPLMRPIEGGYLIADAGRTAILEMATAAGLELVESKHRNPLYTTTYGVGEMIADALERGCRRFLLGIGGSATNDAGMGMLEALGFRFLDSTGDALFGSGENLEKVVSIDHSNINPLLREATFEIACDVNNPFSGPQGAAYIFAPQKGADESAVKRLDSGLKHFAKIIAQFNNCCINEIPGAGAAGGLGGGAVVMLGAQLRSGIDMVLDYLDFDILIEGASLIITGEGRMDRQTLMGKSPYGVLKRGGEQKIPVLAIAGRVVDRELLLSTGFADILEISPRDLPLQEATKRSVAESNIKNILDSVDLKKYFII